MTYNDGSSVRASCLNTQNTSGVVRRQHANAKPLPFPQGSRSKCQHRPCQIRDVFYLGTYDGRGGTERMNVSVHLFTHATLGNTR